MRSHKAYKRALGICMSIAIFLLILPSSYISGGVKDTFDLSRMRYSGLDINRFDDRLTTLQDICQTVNKSTIRYPRTLLYSKGLNTVYCPVPLAYSTWFKHTMLQIESKPLQLKQQYNISTAQAVHAEAQTLNLKHSILLKPEELADGPQHTIVIVRDPWQRLIAAYDDIVVRQHSYKTQCSKFIDKFSRELKFEGFLLCLLHYANGSHGLHRLDHKLSPIHSICSVCRVPYTYIIRYESLGPDLYDFITNTKVVGREKFLELYHQNTMPVNFPLSVINSYVNSVDTPVILHIQQLYALDFKLFAYALQL